MVFTWVTSLTNACGPGVVPASCWFFLFPVEEASPGWTSLSFQFDSSGWLRHFPGKRAVLEEESRAAAWKATPSWHLPQRQPGSV
jgi:hypothetical protein